MTYTSANLISRFSQVMEAKREKMKSEQVKRLETHLKTVLHSNYEFKLEEFKNGNIKVTAWNKTLPKERCIVYLDWFITKYNVKRYDIKHTVFACKYEGFRNHIESQLKQWDLFRIIFDPNAGRNAWKNGI